jgi:Ecdysteroid kinase-like family
MANIRYRIDADAAGLRHVRRQALRRVPYVLVSAALERRRQRAPVRRDGVPRSPYDISAEWLDGVLGAAAPGARVTCVTPLHASVGTTTRAALSVQYNAAGIAAGLPTQLFVKCTSTAAQRLMLGLGGLIYGEPGFYTCVRPKLEIEAPQGFYGAVEPRSWRSIVVLEDVVRTRGARFWELPTRVTRRQIEDLVATVATWHGRLWNSPLLAQWRWLKTPAQQMQVIDALIAFADRTGAGATRAHAVIPRELRGRAQDLYAGMRRSLQAASCGPRTYLHGDLHVANTYFLPQGTIGVADWQVGLQGSWAHDYAYILTTALEVEDRRTWERELLDFYLDRLAAAGGAAPPRNDAWEAYRRATLYPYFAWIYTLGRSRLQPRFQPDTVSLALIQRIAAAIDDLGSLRAVGL